MSFSGYTHIEEYVEAVQLGVDTQDVIVKALNEPAARLELARLAITYNTQEACYEFIFRYKEESTDQSLNVGDYLVRLNNGNYAVYSEEVFKKEYIHTAIDPIIPQCETRTLKEALLEIIKKECPAAGVDSLDQLTPAILQSISNGLLAWFDAPNNTFHAKFNDAGLVNFVGLADLMLAFPAANFMDDESKVVLEFNNGFCHEGDVLCQKNMFNLIGLQSLLAELKRLPAEARARLVGIDMMANASAQGALSAVAPSVTDDMFGDFSLMVCGLCPNMGSVSKVRR